MKRKSVGLLFFVSLILSGCMIKHDYNWSEYAIDGGRISSGTILSDTRVNLIKGKTDQAEYDLGHVGAHHYFSSRQHLNDSIIEHLRIELLKRGAIIDESVEKSIMVTLTESKFEIGMWKLAVNFMITVELGSGVKKELKVRNSSPATVETAYNGAVALAVIEIMNNQEIMSYLK